MNTVQPIRDPAVIERICELLQEKSTRDYLLFLCGIYTGLRVSDLRQLRVADIRDKSHIVRREQKTGKEARMLVNPRLKREAKRLLAGRGARELLFPSRKGAEPLGRWMVYHIVHDVARQAGMQDAVGCHTLRKTFGYHHYQQFRDVHFLMRWYNHDSQDVTMRYICESQDRDDTRMSRFRIGGTK